MPIYAYRCDRCGARKDVLQKVSDAPLTVCTECGAPSFHKELTAPAFQLKGSGWYVTDFRDNGKSKAGDAKPSSDASSTASGGAGSSSGGTASSSADSGSSSGASTGAGGGAASSPASGSAP